ncbi:DedA family protein [Salinifilum ghardaiensis]
MVPVEAVLASGWAPLLIALVILGSAVFPPLPSETVLVAATGAALAGGLPVTPVLLATTSGALLGDVAAYALGRVLSRRARGVAARPMRGRRVLRWLEERETTWGAGMVVAGRFVPGGTTAVGVSAGVLAYPFPRFLAAAAVGAVLWTGYGLTLASLGRAVLPGSSWGGVLLGIALTLTVAGLLRLLCGVRIRGRRTARAQR